MRVARVVAAVLALAGMPQGAGAQVRVFVRDAGPGELGRLARAVLVRPYVLFAGDTGDVVLNRDTTLHQSVVVIGRDLRIASAVQGDVLVVGGDVFLRPGARIDGSVIAAGGAVMPSLLAVVGGEQHSFLDETLVPTRLPDGSWALDYRALRERTYALLSWPGIRGLRIPTYDRVNGITLPFGPLLSLGRGRIGIEPTVTYRSHLGTLDPSVAGTLAMGRRGRVTLDVARTTRTNDDWISGSFGNSLGSLFSGRDTRNWYRADRAEAAVHRLYEGATSEITPYVGAQWERAWSTGIQSPPEHVAFSVLQRSDTVEGMARPNPLIEPGSIASAVAGFDGRWEAARQDLVVRSTGRLEVAPQTPGDRRFTQLTLDGRVTFPLTRTVEFRFDWHALATAGDAPPQRYTYLGGSGTLPTVDLLSRGGDQVVFTETRVSMPLELVKLPFVGAPTLSLRHMMGAAGVGGLPGLTHNLGVRLTLAVIRAEFVIDPVTGATDPGLAISFTR